MSMRKNIERSQLNALFKRITHLGYEAPSSIRDSERPDFILEIPGRIIGLETTSAVYQEYERARRLHRTVCPEGCIAMSGLKDGQRRRSNDEIVHDMLTIGGPWQDAEEEMLDWREKIADSLNSKRAKLSDADFQRFDENWLLICDEPSLPDDVFTYDRACRHLTDIFSKAPSTPNDFDSVFIYSERYLFRWRESQLALNYERS
jgi:hypothetical protein